MLTGGSAALAEVKDPTSESPREIVVTAKPVEHYLAFDAVTGVRTPADLKDLPLSVSVVPQELIKDRGLTALGEALDNVAGAQRKPGYGGVQNFGAYLRGFDSSFLTLRNGVRDFGFYTLRDTADVERFEILKGPGSVLYGAVYPGGITNTVTKQPTDRPIAHVEGIVGSYDRYRGEVDLGGPLSNTFGYRFNASAETADSFRDMVHNRSYFVAPVISWRPGTATAITVELEHKHSVYTWDLGLPRSPISLRLPISRFLGESDKQNHVSSTYASATLQQRIADGWNLRQVIGYTWTDGDYALRSALNFAANGRTVNRVAYDTWEKSHTFVSQSEIAGEFATGALTHKLAIGLEYYDIQQKYSFDFKPLASIDALNPVYGAKPGAGFTLFADDVKSSAWGLYAQDLISVGSMLKVLLGGRYDWARNSDFDLLAKSLARKSKDQAFSPQAGLVFQPDAATNLYVNYGESFLPITSGRTSAGKYLDPETGQQVEAGIKRYWLNNRLGTTLAVYQIDKQNVSTTDPVNPTFRVQTGEQRSRGVELEANGSPAANWDVAFAASYIDAKVTRDNRIPVGSRLPGAPKYSASVWNKLTVPDGALKGLTGGLGIYYVDNRQLALPNLAFTLPSYTRFDMMFAYARGGWKAQLNIKNLTDKRIYDLTSTSIFPQEPRSFTIRLSHDFG